MKRELSNTEAEIPLNDVIGSKPEISEVFRSNSGTFWRSRMYLYYTSGNRNIFKYKPFYRLCRETGKKTRGIDVLHEINVNSQRGLNRFGQEYRVPSVDLPLLSLRIYRMASIDISFIRARLFFQAYRTGNRNVVAERASDTPPQYVR